MKSLSTSSTQSRRNTRCRSLRSYILVRLLLTPAARTAQGEVPSVAPEPRVESSKEKNVSRTTATASRSRRKVARNRHRSRSPRDVAAVPFTAQCSGPDSDLPRHRLRESAKPIAESAVLQVQVKVASHRPKVVRRSQLRLPRRCTKFRVHPSLAEGPGIGRLPAATKRRCGPAHRWRLAFRRVRALLGLRSPRCFPPFAPTAGSSSPRQSSTAERRSKAGSRACRAFHRASQPRLNGSSG